MIHLALGMYHYTESVNMRDIISICVASSYQPPNLPPRLQRSHQQSATFQPRFHAVSQPAPSSQTWTGGGFGGGQQQQGGGTRFRPDEGQLRHRTGSASDNPGNRLHPQHTLNSMWKHTHITHISHTHTYARTHTPHLSVSFIVNGYWLDTAIL